MPPRIILPNIRQNVVAVVGAMALTSVISKPILAEEPPRKSIYDDIPPPSPPQAPSTIDPSMGHFSETSPTIRLSKYVRQGRLATHSYVTTAQHQIDTYFNKFLNAEHSLTSTVASVGPSRTSNEQLLPGTLYVAVATMAGAIVSRRRFFPVRALTPVAVGIAASWYFLPETTRNVADLTWRYEEKVPQIAEAHLQTRKVLEDSWRTVEGSTRDGRRLIEDSVSKARVQVEEWVRKQ